MSINKVMLTGRLTRDPELRSIGNGISMTHILLAVDDGFGERRTSYFFNCVAWRVTAEYIAKNAHTGDLVAITGKLQERSWEKDGQRKYRTEVVIDDFVFVGRKRALDDLPEKADDSEQVPEIDRLFPPEN